MLLRNAVNFRDGDRYVANRRKLWCDYSFSELLKQYTIHKEPKLSSESRGYHPSSGKKMITTIPVNCSVYLSLPTMGTFPKYSR